MTQTIGSRANLTRRRVIQGNGATGLTSALATPSIAQNKPIRLGWIAALTGIFATNA